MIGIFYTSFFLFFSLFRFSFPSFLINISFRVSLIGRSLPTHTPSPSLLFTLHHFFTFWWEAKSRERERERQKIKWKEKKEEEELRNKIKPFKLKMKPWRPEGTWLTTKLIYTFHFLLEMVLNWIESTKFIRGSRIRGVNDLFAT